MALTPLRDDGAFRWKSLNFIDRLHASTACRNYQLWALVEKKDPQELLASRGANSPVDGGTGTERMSGTDRESIHRLTVRALPDYQRPQIQQRGVKSDHSRLELKHACEYDN